jgi:serine/threonine-protein kinase
MLAAGSRVGDYEIEADLGEGGMARVYRARHAMLDTHHAVKVLDPGLRANADVRQRFLDEARIQAKHLDHPGIVKVTNIVATAEHAALVMELVDGGSLETELHALADRPDEIRRIMLAVLDAVGHAHAHGIVHRDLKPANVLLHRRGGQVIPKVTDFGIAKLGADGGRAKKSTVAGARMGTLGYMSPEQIRRAKDVTAQSDIFSLGAMLYELTTGAVPFEGNDDFEVMEKIVHARYPDPGERRPGIDPVFVEVIRRALSPRPEERYASCEEMAAALRQTGAGAATATATGAATATATATGAARATGATTTRSSATRSLVQIVAILGGVAVVGGAIAGGLYLWHRSNQPTLEPVRPPVAADLARYRKALGLTGPIKATIATSQGTLTCELFDDKAPIAVASFVGLATGLKPWRDALTGKVKRGVPFYDGRVVHRVVPGISIHLGRGAAKVSSSDPGYRFENEPGGTHAPGALATIYEAGKGNGAELNLLEVDLSDVGLNDTVFGQCGPLEVIGRIARVRADADERPVTPVTIDMVAIGAR